MIKAGNKGDLVEKRITGTGTAGLFVGILGVAIVMGIRKKGCGLKLRKPG